MVENGHLLRTMTALALAIAWGTAAAACGDGGPGSVAGTRSGAPTAGATPSSAPAAPSASSSQSSAGSAGAAPAPAASASPFAGTWKGSYRAEKVKPTLDPTVDDDVWRDDDGKRHAGAGEIELTIDPEGTVSGTIDGALASRIHGVSDDGMVRASVVSPAEDGASGTLTGKRQGDGLAVEIRTSDGTGKTPRVARGTLQR